PSGPPAIGRHGAREGDDAGGIARPPPPAIPPGTQRANPDRSARSGKPRCRGESCRRRGPEDSARETQRNGGAPGGPMRMSRLRIVHSSSFNGQRDTEAGPLARGAFDLNAAAMIGHDAVADAQAQSGPFADGFRGEERLEDP